MVSFSLGLQLWTLQGGRVPKGHTLPGGNSKVQLSHMAATAFVLILWTGGKEWGPRCGRLTLGSSGMDPDMGAGRKTRGPGVVSGPLPHWAS